ncbi:MAG: hypothetical protein ABWZ25_04045 [Chitinophagaceae bacterium]
MSDYIAVFTIVGGTNADYTTLKSLLDHAGFSKKIRSKQGVDYYLPPHTYFASTDRDSNHVFELATNNVKRLRKNYSVFVTQASSSVWVGLDRA